MVGTVGGETATSRRAKRIQRATQRLAASEAAYSGLSGRREAAGRRTSAHQATFCGRRRRCAVRSFFAPSSAPWRRRLGCRRRPPLDSERLVSLTPLAITEFNRALLQPCWRLVRAFRTFLTHFCRIGQRSQCPALHRRRTQAQHTQARTAVVAALEGVPEPCTEGCTLDKPIMTRIIVVLACAASAFRRRPNQDPLGHTAAGFGKTTKSKDKAVQIKGAPKPMDKQWDNYFALKDAEGEIREVWLTTPGGDKPLPLGFVAAKKDGSPKEAVGAAEEVDYVVRRGAASAPVALPAGQDEGRSGETGAQPVQSPRAERGGGQEGGGGRRPARRGHRPRRPAGPARPGPRAAVAESCRRGLHALQEPHRRRAGGPESRRSAR